MKAESSDRFSLKKSKKIGRLFSKYRTFSARIGQIRLALKVVGLKKRRELLLILFLCLINQLYTADAGRDP